MLGIRLGGYAITVEGLGPGTEVRWSVATIRASDFSVPVASGSLFTTAGDEPPPARVVVSALEIGFAVARALSTNEGEARPWT